jgi:hypothetical protein
MQPQKGKTKLWLKPCVKEGHFTLFIDDRHGKIRYTTTLGLVKAGR